MRLRLASKANRAGGNKEIRREAAKDNERAAWCNRITRGLQLR